MNRSISSKSKKRNSLKIDASPYNERNKRSLVRLPSNFSNNSMKIIPEVLSTANSVMQSYSNKKKSSSPSNYQYTYGNLEKAKRFSVKLADLLSSKTSEKTEFQIYSKVYSELAEYLCEYKEILEILRKGLVVFAIKEREIPSFEFRTEANAASNEIGAQLDKERKEKTALIHKLNALSVKNLELVEENKKILVKLAEYEKAVHRDPNMFIDAEKLVEKMMKQCEIIRTQQIHIHELKTNEFRLEKIIQYCESKGIKINELVEERKNTVINPNMYYRAPLNKSLTLHSFL